MALHPLSATEPGLGLVRDGHMTRLVWHRGRRRAADLPFTAARIVEGLRLGAAVEIDLRRHAGGGFAVLHDADLDRETTGAGPVAGHDPAALRTLALRDASGQASGHRLLLLEDLLADLTTEALPEAALLQLDLKETTATLAGFDAALFGRAAAPLAGHLIVSARDAAAAWTLAVACPGLRIGYDPCHGAAHAALATSGAFADFIAAALAAAPTAALYLDWRTLRLAATRGIDLVAPCHAAGRTVAAWTLNPDDADAEAALRLLLDLRVDQVITDDPVGLEALGVRM